MGASNGNGKHPPAQELSKEHEELFGEALSDTQDLVDTIEESGKPPTREFALALTKLEEAEMWLQRGFDKLGYDEEVDEDDEDEAESDEGQDKS